MKFLKKIFGLNGRLDRRGYLLFGVLPMIGWILLVDNFYSFESKIVALILFILLFILSLVSIVKRGRDSGLNGLVTLLLFGAIPKLVIVLSEKFQINLLFMAFAFIAYLLLMPSSSKEQKIGKVEYILTFIFILLLIVSLIVPHRTCVIGENLKANLTCEDMQDTANALELFKFDNGIYPTTDEGFNVLVSNPNTLKYPNYPNSSYAGKLPKDAWGNYFIYVKTKDRFELISYGADRKEGGEDDGADILYSECESKR